MNKKIIFISITLILLVLIPLTVFAATPTVSVKINGTTLSTGTSYIIDEGQSIVISGAYTGGTVSKIYYKIGTSTTVNVSSNTTTITIPTSYTNAGEFSLNVLSYGSDGTQSGWKQYSLEVKKETVIVKPATTVKINGTTLSSSSTYTIDEGQAVALSATHSSGISKIYYKIGTSTTTYVSGTSGNITIPASYTNTGVFTLNVSAVSKDGTQEDWVAYKLQVVKEVVTVSPVVTVKISSTTLNTANTYKIDEGQAVAISATHTSGISKIYYKIGTSSSQTISSSSGNITIPTSYTNTGEFTLNVSAVSKDGTQSNWVAYKLQVVKEVATTLPVVTVKINGTTLNTANTYKIDEGQAVSISATHSSGISKIYYKIGTSSSQTISSSSGNITIPTSYTNTGVFTLNVSALSKDGTQSDWMEYKLQVVKEVATTLPVVAVKINGTTLNTTNTYKIDEGQAVSLSATHTSGIGKIYYKIGTSTTTYVSGSSGNITIPTSYTNTGVFTLNVSALSKDGTQSNWVEYKLQVVKDVATTLPVVAVKINGTALNTANTYKIDEGQAVAISATHTSGISKIYYKIGTSSSQTISSSSGNITIPTSYTNTGTFSLNVCAVSTDGKQSAWTQYNLQVVKEDVVVVKPVVTVKINSTTLNTTNTYKIDEGQQVSISATHSNGISKIYYKIGTSSSQIISSSNGNITIPTSYTNTGVFSLNVCAVSTDGIQSAWTQYNLQVVKEVVTVSPVVTVKVNGTMLNTTNTYKIDEGQPVAISATHSSGISKIYYKIGTSSSQIISSSSGNITIPTSYTNTGTFSLNVCAVSTDGTQSAWTQYNLQVVKDAAVKPVVTVKINGATLNTANTYTIDEGQAIAISATHSNGISKIYYKIGTSSSQIISSSSGNITIPTSYTNTGAFSLNVSAVSTDGTQSAWTQYNLQVVKDVVVVKPVVTVKVNGTILNTSNTYMLDEGEEITLSATHSSGISKIQYRIGTSNLQTISGSSGNITIPASYTNTGELSLNVCAYSSDGTQSNWSQYKLSVEKELVKPTIKVMVDDITLNTTNTYMIDEGQRISLFAAHSSGISKIQYKIGTSSSQTINNSSGTIIVPETYTNTGEFSINVTAFASDGTQSDWVQYKFLIEKEVLVPTIKVKVDETILNTTNTYMLDEGKEITLIASHSDGIKNIQYKIGTSSSQTINDSTGTITIPETYTGTGEFSLNVKAVSNSGIESEWIQYRLEIVKETQCPVVNVYDSNDAQLAIDSINALYKESNIKYNATHATGISKVIYWFDDMAKQNITEPEGTITVNDIYKDGEQHKFSIYSVAKDGTTSETQVYYIQYVLSDTDYSLVLNYDEQLNSNIEGLAVSIRNIAVKEGNDNTYALNETVKYYINFANYGSDITDKVIIKFHVPQNVGITYVNTMDGDIIGDKTVEWTFNNGIKSKKSGTIVLTLKYTSLPNTNYETVQPRATITSGNMSDTSAIVNLIYKSSSDRLNVSHIPYMFGDAGDTTFRPNDGLNRAELAIILVRIFDLDVVENPVVTYADASTIAEDQFRWSTQAIMTVTKYGLMEGYEDGTFRPGTKVTKAQMITIIARRFEVENGDPINPYKIKEKPITLFKMNTTHWAIPYISQMMRLNMISDVLEVNDNSDEIITRGEVTRLVNACLFRGPSTDGTGTATLTNTFSDVNRNTAYYTDIVEATANTHNAKFAENGIETMIK